MYPYEKIVWNGMMKTTTDNTFYFICHMTKTSLIEPRMKIEFTLAEGN